MDTALGIRAQPMNEVNLTRGRQIQKAALAKLQERFTKEGNEV
jgi:hypothetical protein